MDVATLARPEHGNMVTTIAGASGVAPCARDAIVSVDLAKRLATVHYVGYRDSGPVPTSLGLTTGRTIGVYDNGRT